MNNYKEVMTDANVLYESRIEARKASAWKRETMKCDLDYLSVIARKQKELKDEVYTKSKSHEFFINERGRPRQVTSTDIASRIVRHALCDNILVPELTKKITKQKRKLRKLKIKLENGEIDYKSVENYFKSWFGAHKKYMKNKQRKELLNLYNELFINDWRYEND